MSPPDLPLELLLMIAHNIRDDDDELRYDDFNSFLQINRTLYACLNRLLWQQAREHEVDTQRVLTHLIGTNNLAGLEFFLELGADVEVGLPSFGTSYDSDNEYEEFGMRSEPTPLLVAADLDNVPLALLLLEKGAQVQYVSHSTATGDFSPISPISPMHAARSAEMVHLLLDHDADPEMKDYRNRTPLHRYASRGNIEAMRVVLQRGVEVDPHSRSILGSCTPLHEAARHGVEAVSILLEFGANIESRDNNLDTPLHHAAKRGKTEVVRLLVERWPEGVREKDGPENTPLHLAAEMGETEAVRLLLEHWPEGVREKNWLLSLSTPLHLAATAGDTEAVRLLVERCPEGVKAKDRYLDTPLHLAAAQGWVKVVKFLFERWPEGIREKNKNLDTPLHLLGKMPHMAAVLHFMAESWPEGLSMKNKDGRTPKAM
jgi:ankyrin repeat protein